METLRFFGWKPDLAVIEILSTGDAAVASRVHRGSADLAISYGNLVTWERQFHALAHLKALHGALKPGAVLGVVENRIDEGRSFRQMMAAGAITEEHAIALAEVAGFRLAGRSEVNAGGLPARMTLKFVRP
jgi:predicted methyltransferase